MNCCSLRRELLIPIMLWSNLITSRAMTMKASHMGAMLARIQAVNSPPPPDDCVPFVVDGIHLGQVRPRMTKLFCDTNVFAMEHNVLTLNPAVAGTTCASRTEAVASVTKEFHNQGIISGWRDEDYAIKARFDDPDPVFLMERAAVPFIGALEYGVHINGVVQATADHAALQLWLARRSYTKSKYPGYLVRINTRRCAS